MTTLLRGLGLIVPLLIVGVAHGVTLNFVAPLGLTEDQEFPSTGSPATGTGTAELDTVALSLTVHLTWEDLTGPAGAAHIHCCPGPGANGPVAIDFVPAGFPNVAAGSFDHTFDLDDAASYGVGFLALFGGDVDAARAAVIAGLTDGLTYFNIHTQLNPGGEIRGDIVQVVPGPGALILLALGLGAAVARRRLG
jgi:CHRD domain